MGQVTTDAAAPHNLPAEQVVASLGSSRHGLSSEEAARRLLEYGRNELQREKAVSPLEIFLGQFKNFLIVILLAAAVVSFAVGERVDAIVIGVIILFASGLGFVQEYRAEKAMEALKRMAALSSTVVRDGEDVDVPAAEVVPGDIVVLSTGDRVPADCRLLEAWNLNADEASLTGESLPVEKTVEVIEGEAALGDRRNMVYSGTSLTFGRGVGVVVATGMATEFGKIAGMLQKVEMERTPLQADLDKMGRLIGLAALSTCALVGSLGYFLGAFEGDDAFDKLTEAFIWVVSLAVAAVPEALPAVVTISLAVGVRRMVRRHALIRRLPVVETLGCTTVICSDKTGTLTRDEMTVRRVYVDGQTIEVTGVGYEPTGHFTRDGSVLSPASDPSRTPHVPASDDHELPMLFSANSS